MGRRTKEAARKAKYRERTRRRQQAADLDSKVEELRRLIKHEAPRDLLVDYVRIADALDQELARLPRRTRAIQELVGSKARLAEQLGITPRERRLAGERDEESIGEALARSVENARRAMRDAAENEAADDARFNKPIDATH